MPSTSSPPHLPLVRRSKLYDDSMHRKRAVVSQRRGVVSAPSSSFFHPPPRYPTPISHPVVDAAVMTLTVYIERSRRAEFGLEPRPKMLEGLMVHIESRRRAVYRARWFTYPPPVTSMDTCYNITARTATHCPAARSSAAVALHTQTLGYR
ncbi:hypothetical protein SCHPADRAFT_947337 [Schizopora paradoxa]|uniref:Uncharacterized protein n=1 Tax=Schizopora paradoxa TaxID=27342 RepID=A0A0H2QZJ5_9AGAM|nr:hypothetical protein SCHPADRAFT_947337 [Schizopora paradoxa]